MGGFCDLRLLLWLVVLLLFIGVNYSRSKILKVSQSAGSLIGADIWSGHNIHKLDAFDDKNFKWWSVHKTSLEVGELLCQLKARRASGWPITEHDMIKKLKRLFWLLDHPIFDLLLVILCPLCIAGLFISEHSLNESQYLAALRFNLLVVYGGIFLLSFFKVCDKLLSKKNGESGH
ncbi:MAG: hypothetical protein ABSC01_05965 [Verrucomicrobiota bacterium]